MTVESVIDLVRQAVMATVICSGPILVISVVVGLVVSILQTTTSIQEQSLVFVPKIIAVLGALIYFGQFIVTKLVELTMSMFNGISGL